MFDRNIDEEFLINITSLYLSGVQDGVLKYNHPEFGDIEINFTDFKNFRFTIYCYYGKEIGKRYLDWTQEYKGINRHGEHKEFYTNGIIAWREIWQDGKLISIFNSVQK